MSEPPVVTDKAIAEATRAVRGVYGAGAASGSAGIIRTAVTGAAREILAAGRQLLVAETADEVTAVAEATVLEAVAISTARIAALEAALTDVLTRFVTTSSGRTARVSGTVLARWQAIASGQDGGEHGG